MTALSFRRLFLLLLLCFLPVLHGNERPNSNQKPSAVMDDDEPFDDDDDLIDDDDDNPARGQLPRDDDDDIFARSGGGGGGKVEKKEVKLLDVIELTSRNFDSNIRDGNIWLIEFWAPWCSHCTSFASTYSDVAAYFHGQENSGVKVAKVNSDQEQALTSRFGVNSYPSFYIVDGWSVYSFEEGRSRKTLIDYAEGGYKKDEPMPFYSSPMGPLGLIQGLLIWCGMSVADTFEGLQKNWGLSALVAGGLMFGSAFMGCFFTLVFLAIVITPKAKVE